MVYCALEGNSNGVLFSRASGASKDKRESQLQERSRVASCCGFNAQSVEERERRVQRASGRSLRGHRRLLLLLLLFLSARLSLLHRHASPVLIVHASQACEALLRVQSSAVLEQSSPCGRVTTDAAVNPHAIGVARAGERSASATAIHT